VNDIVIYQLVAPSVSCGTDGTASPSH